VVFLFSLKQNLVFGVLVLRIIYLIGFDVLLWGIHDQWMVTILRGFFFSQIKIWFWGFLVMEFMYFGFVNC
jgi:hypothetical protein